MKQQEIFKAVYKIVKKFAFVSIAVVVLAMGLSQHAYAALGDPKFFFMEQPVTSTVMVGDKKIPTVTFKVAATSSNGTTWTAPGDTRVYIDIAATGGVDKQNVQIPVDGRATVTFTNLIPNATYTITPALEELKGLEGYKKRSLDTPLGYFQAPAGDSPSETALFSYSQQPQTSIITQDGKPVSIVKLLITSKVDENISVVITPTGGGTVAQYALFKKNEPTTVTFTSLVPNKQYSVMIARYVPSTTGGEGTYQQVAALGGFTSVSAPLVTTPTTPSPTPTTPAPTNPTPQNTSVPRVSDTGLTAKLGTTCTDGIDNDGDKRADYYGTATMDPDPACFAIDAEETADDVAAGSLVPCTNKCGLRDVFVLLNNVLKFVISKLLIPLFVVLIMYIGFKYLTSQGKPGMHVKFKKILWNVFIGLVLILTAWLIVRTLLTTLGVTDGLLFFD